MKHPELAIPDISKLLKRSLRPSNRTTLTPQVNKEQPKMQPPKKPTWK